MGGIRDNNIELQREKRVFKDWFCPKCNNRLFTSHVVQDSTGVHQVRAHVCCGQPMLDWAAYSRQKNHKMYIVKDIDPYMTVAADKKTGDVTLIKSRREHAEFLKRNEYIELGNEPLKPPKQNEKIITANDIGYAAANCKEILASDEYKEYTHKANKE